MTHYQQRLVIEAEPAVVYAALTTTHGLRGWWSEDCHADSRVGGLLNFGFGACSKQMRVERLVATQEVAWLCTRAHIDAAGVTRPDEWVGTEMVFRLAPDGEGRTVLQFEHLGLVPDLQCWAVCNQGWNYFLPSLKQFAETGRGTPFALEAQAA